MRKILVRLEKTVIESTTVVYEVSDEQDETLKKLRRDYFDPYTDLAWTVVEFDPSKIRWNHEMTDSVNEIIEPYQLVSDTAVFEAGPELVEAGIEIISQKD